MTKEERLAEIKDRVLNYVPGPTGDELSPFNLASYEFLIEELEKAWSELEGSN